MQLSEIAIGQGGGQVEQGGYWKRAAASAGYGEGCNFASRWAACSAGTVKEAKVGMRCGSAIHGRLRTLPLRPVAAALGAVLRLECDAWQAELQQLTVCILVASGKCCVEF